MPESPALIAGHGHATLLSADGEVLNIAPGALAQALGHIIPLVVHGPATLRRLGDPAVPVIDLLELFAFICPAQSLAPTPAGLARAREMDI
ncbi:MAG: hypothetical protein POH28_02545, partial [Acidocella sp.]|nr:hypothetical protein [Acidocella sp.]